MSKLYAVKVIRVTTQEAMVIVQAPDRHSAVDAAYDFAKLGTAKLDERYQTTGRTLEVYAGTTQEIGSGTPDTVVRDA